MEETEILAEDLSHLPDNTIVNIDKIPESLIEGEHVLPSSPGTLTESFKLSESLLKLARCPAPSANDKTTLFVSSCGNGESMVLEESRPSSSPENTEYEENSRRGWFRNASVNFTLNSSATPDCSLNPKGKITGSKVFKHSISLPFNWAEDSSSQEPTDVGLRLARPSVRLPSLNSSEDVPASPILEPLTEKDVYNEIDSGAVGTRNRNVSLARDSREFLDKQSYSDDLNTSSRENVELVDIPASILNSIQEKTNNCTLSDSITENNVDENQDSSWTNCKGATVNVNLDSPTHGEVISSQETCNRTFTIIGSSVKLHSLNSSYATTQDPLSQGIEKDAASASAKGSNEEGEHRKSCSRFFRPSVKIPSLDSTNGNADLHSEIDAVVEADIGTQPESVPSTQEESFGVNFKGASVNFTFHSLSRNDVVSSQEASIPVPQNVAGASVNVSSLNSSCETSKCPLTPNRELDNGIGASSVNAEVVDYFEDPSSQKKADVHRESVNFTLNSQSEPMSSQETDTWKPLEVKLRRISVDIPSVSLDEDSLKLNCNSERQLIPVENPPEEITSKSDWSFEMCPVLDHEESIVKEPITDETLLSLVKESTSDDELDVLKLALSPECEDLVTDKHDVNLMECDRKSKNSSVCSDHSPENDELEIFEAFLSQKNMHLSGGESSRSNSRGSPQKTNEKLEDRSETNDGNETTVGGNVADDSSPLTSTATSQDPHCFTLEEPSSGISIDACTTLNSENRKSSKSDLTSSGSKEPTSKSRRRSRETRNSRGSSLKDKHFESSEIDENVDARTKSKSDKRKRSRSSGNSPASKKSSTILKEKSEVQMVEFDSSTAKPLKDNRKLTSLRVPLPQNEEASKMADSTSVDIVPAEKPASTSANEKTVENCNVQLTSTPSQSSTLGTDLTPKGHSRHPVRDASQNLEAQAEPVAPLSSENDGLQPDALSTPKRKARKIKKSVNFDVKKSSTVISKSQPDMLMSSDISEVLPRVEAIFENESSEEAAPPKKSSRYMPTPFKKKSSLKPFAVPKHPALKKKTRSRVSFKPGDSVILSQSDDQTKNPLVQNSKNEEMNFSFGSALDISEIPKVPLIAHSTPKNVNRSREPVIEGHSKRKTSAQIQTSLSESSQRETRSKSVTASGSGSVTSNSQRVNESSAIDRPPDSFRSEFDSTVATIPSLRKSRSRALGRSKNMSTALSSITEIDVERTVEENPTLVALYKGRKNKRVDLELPRSPKVKKPAKTPLSPGTLKSVGLSRDTHKRFKPAKWVTNDLYNFLEKKLDAEFGVDARTNAEKIVTVMHVTHVKIQKNQLIADDVEALKSELQKYGVCHHKLEYGVFVRKFMPSVCFIKLVPCGGIKGSSHPKDGGLAYDPL